MRLFIKPTAPSVLRVLMFAAECGAELKTIDVSELTERQLVAINSLRSVPVLETSDGGFIPESLTICRYLDALWGTEGNTVLFGRSPRQKIEIEIWDRRAELLLLIPSVEFAHHTHPMFSGMVEQQHGAWARSTARRTCEFLDVMDAHLQDRPYLAGDAFSMADITAFLGLTIFTVFGGMSDPLGTALGRWREELAKRPTMDCLTGIASRLQNANS